ncbi:S8 family serine peptidase [Actinokineospora spheciospongiae]|uniref:S8 family serine peptidase n=1 Tax=Actinokineospora spheciospongiae TaxID=909613 RepID=UPI000D71BA70|nr:S8 family serine peptidase [Actinokineospora spheciospongiae]PWW63038.1 subtilase family protein [Actinokineospora spheciospongiae]
MTTPSRDDGTADDGTTGRYLVLLEDDSVAAGTRELNRIAGIDVAATVDATGPGADLRGAGGLVLDRLGVAVVDADPDQAEALARAAAASGPIAGLERERRVRAITAEEVQTAVAVDESVFTWGLQAVGAQLSTATGAGIRVAVLDTGFDLAHPDFAGRQVTAESFVPGESAQDGHGHGTHCVGTSCGPREPGDGPGYGIASAAEIYVGKVLSDGGSGSDGGILSGIAWAVENGCAVVSMSLGAATQPGQPFSRTFERVATRAMAQGTLIVAAAGNESDRRTGAVAPVGHPANCPSILAVGAVDAAEAIAYFSCGTVDRIGSVDVVGPGVDVLSSWPMPLRHNRISGTSMATPHVAGVAALIAQATGARSWALWARLAQSAIRQPLPSTDVGAGLVQAP